MRRSLLTMLLIGLIAMPGGAAWARVVVVVSEDSPVETLTATQLEDIFLGRLTRLPDGVTVQPVDQAEKNSVYEDFYRAFLGRSRAQIRSHWSRLIFTGRGQPPRAVEGVSALMETLMRNPNAIGYVDDSALPQQGVRVIEIDS